MPERSPTRFIPLAVLLLLLGGLAAYYGPGVWRIQLLKRTCSEMLARVEAGNLQGVTPYVATAQRTPTDQFFALVPPGYEQQLRDLRILRVERAAKDRVGVIVSVKVGADGGVPHQGYLYWDWDGSQWLWDFNSTLYAPWPTSGAPQWQGIDTVLQLAEQAYN